MVWCSLSLQRESYLPAVEVQRSQLAKVDIRHVHIEGLRLVNVSTPVCGHVHQYSLLDLPHCLVQSFEVLRQLQILHGNAAGQDRTEKFAKFGQVKAVC